MNAFPVAVTMRKQNHEVKVFLLGEAVECEGLTHEKVNVDEQLREKPPRQGQSKNENRRCRMRFHKSLLIVFAGFLLLILKGRAFAQWGGGYGCGGMGPGMMGGWGMGWFGGIFMIVIWVLVIVGLIFFIKWLIQSTKSDKDIIQGSSRALDIVKERYARGEIDKEEFQRMKADLQS